jgi:class 3 adenylate cyclase
MQFRVQWHGANSRCPRWSSAWSPRADESRTILSVVTLLARLAPAWRILERGLRPLTHAGVPATTSRAGERELVTANIVVLFAIAVTVPDAINYLTLHHVATRYAAVTAWVAIAVYVTGFALLATGRRWLGVFLFTYAVLANLTTLTIILGTLCGNQYYFVAVGIGAMFVWPRAHKRMRIPLAFTGLVLFFLSMRIALPGPIVGPPLPREMVESIFFRQTMGAYVITFGLAFYALFATERAEAALEREHQQSESLLLNILPKVIADRLKERSDVIADAFDEVTILFADVVGFTPLSARLAPSELVALLNQLFSKFDRLADKYGLEKIKTIGDAYMVVGGIPVARIDHAQAIASMALEMMEIARATESALSLRIGINSGPAIAGVIGIKKFAYDLWGDTVNTASRMESHGIPGSIQVSEATHQLLRDEFEFEERGRVDVKGKGWMNLYILRGRR